MLRRCGILLAIFLCANATAQFNYYKLSLSAEAGPAYPFCDLSRRIPVNFALSASFGRRFTAYSQWLCEVQYGTLSGGGQASDPGRRYFRNRYRTASIQVEMELSQVYCFTQAPVLKPFRNVYFAAGAGIIQNQLTDIRRSLITQEGRIYIFPGTSRSIGAALPFTAGFHIHFHDFWGYRRITAGISYRLTVATGEGLDGYNDPPPVFRNRHSDMFGALCAGIAYHFGPVGLYQ